MKIQSNYILKAVFPAETVGKNSTKKVNVLLHKPKPRNEFNEEYGSETNFEAAIFNDKIEESFVKSLLNEKVEAVCFLNSYEYDEVINNVKTGNKRHGLNLTLTSLKRL